MLQKYKAVWVVVFAALVVGAMVSCDFLGRNDSSPTIPVALEDAENAVNFFGGASNSSEYGICYEGGESFTVNVSAGEYLLSYTTEMTKRTFYALVRALEDAKMTIGLTDGDVLVDAALQTGLIGAQTPQESSMVQFLVAGPVWFFQVPPKADWHNLIWVYGDPMPLVEDGDPQLSDLVVPIGCSGPAGPAYTPTEIVMYNAGEYTGNLGGRGGADAKCASSPNRPAGKRYARAFLSVTFNDAVRDMPLNYGVPTNVPLRGPTGTQINPNWASLWVAEDGTNFIETSLEDADVLPSDEYWWSGSDADGEFYTDDRQDGACSRWLDESDELEAGVGYSDDRDEDWITEGDRDCDNEYYLLCITW